MRFVGGRPLCSYNAFVNPGLSDPPCLAPVYMRLGVGGVILSRFLEQCCLPSEGHLLFGSLGTDPESDCHFPPGRGDE